MARTYDCEVSVGPIPCPNCGCEHLHSSIVVDADRDGLRFEVIGPVPAEPDHLLVRTNPAGALYATVSLLCCS
jgi:hypothetical protein